MRLIKTTLLCLMSTILSPAFAEEKFQIKSVTTPKMTRSHLCSALGGSEQTIPVVIKHSKIAGRSINVQMLDDVSSGNVVNHRSTSVTSEASGTTVVNYGFLPPCNKTGRSTSNYSFVVSEGEYSTKKLFGRYDSTSGRIF